MTTAGTQAPLVNFETTTTTSTTPGRDRADPVDDGAPCATRVPSGVWWWRTMPACDRVKPVNTPTA